MSRDLILLAIALGAWLAVEGWLGPEPKSFGPTVFAGQVVRP